MTDDENPDDRGSDENHEEEKEDAAEPDCGDVVDMDVDQREQQLDDQEQTFSAACGDGDREVPLATASGKKQRLPSAQSQRDWDLRDRVGRTVAVSVAGAQFPTLTDMPFRLPVPLADRLGLFFTDGTAQPPGSYPSTDDGQVTIYPSATLVGEDGEAFRIHARLRYHGKPRYSFVAINAKGQLWYARVWVIFSCLFRGQVFRLAACSVLRKVRSEHYHTTRPTFIWHSSHVDCFELGHIVRPVIVVPSYLPRKATDPRVFHLLE
ncbi:MAG: hypothetical protein ACKVQA_26165 [Burkholderiales bacterium]